MVVYFNHIINREEFEAYVRAGLGSNYARALEIFELYGGHCSFLVTNYLVWGFRKKKELQVLQALEAFWCFFLEELKQTPDGVFNHRFLHEDPLCAPVLHPEIDRFFLLEIGKGLLGLEPKTR